MDKAFLKELGIEDENITKIMEDLKSVGAKRVLTQLMRIKRKRNEKQKN